MQVVRTYSSLTEAQMAQLDLEAAGIQADILDEATATLAPHLAFASGIRLAVADGDFEQARELLGLPARLPSARPKGGIPWWFFAIVAASVLTIVLQASRQGRTRGVSQEPGGLDRNHDGRPDTRREQDGGLLTDWFDENFDGKWDYKVIYKDGVAVRSEVDVDFDGSYDAVTEFKDGVPQSTTVRRGGKGPVLRLATYRDGILATALEDRDGNGAWDLRIEYDPYGLQLKREELH